MMRALVMDFPKDKLALDINDQYMFGKSLLVCPVTKAMYSKDSKEDFSITGTKELYLPKGADWFDFWTGDKYTGGQKISREAPVDIIPLYIKAGSIMPYGPRVQYATEKKWDNLEIRVYEGANGVFNLYEDENDNYNYEKGAYSIITFAWDNTKRSLTIGDRKGSFPGMLTDRKFNIVLVTKNKGTGTGIIEKYDSVVNYSGQKMIVKLL
jgi:alpha-D-xyloside xylohydrolase